jgi:hypothetical protein
MMTNQPTEESVKRAFTEMSDNALVRFADAISLREIHNKKDPLELIEKVIYHLQGKKFAITDSTAIRAYIHKRPEQKLDILIEENIWDGLKEFFSTLNAELIGDNNVFMVTVPSYDLVINVIIARSQLNKDALQNVISIPYKGVTILRSMDVNVIKPEFLNL